MPSTNPMIDALALAEEIAPQIDDLLTLWDAALDLHAPRIEACGWPAPELERAQLVVAREALRRIARLRHDYTSTVASMTMDEEDAQ